jgi:predicted RNA binding protein YcfA (HicA-like mRNA interferase family)
LGLHLPWEVAFQKKIQIFFRKHLTYVILRDIIVAGGEGTMTYAELERMLRKAGWKKNEEGRHPKMYHPDKPGIHIPFSHHKTQEVATGTLDKILKDAGLKGKGNR